MPLSRSNLLRLRLKPGSTEAYGFAVFCIAVATLIRWGIGLMAGDSLVYASYYPAVLFATYAGGATAGGFTALLSAAIGWWAFMPPHFAFTPLSVETSSKLLAFLLAAALIIWG